MACMVFASGLVPYIHSIEKSDEAFWTVYLPTVILTGVNVTGFIGRFVSSSMIPFSSFTMSRWVQAPSVLITLSMTIVVFGYIHANKNPFGENNWYIIVLYYILSFINGFSIVSLSSKAQKVCHHSEESVCPVVSQLMWMMIELGSITGVALVRFIQST